MKYVRTSHYVEKSYEDKPSFIIILDDNGVEKSFISNGCQFKELTDDNIEWLISKYDCKEYIQELLGNPIEGGDDITDAGFMLQGSTQLTEVSLYLPKARDCSSLLDGCTSLTKVNLSLPKAKDCYSLLWGCTSLTKVTLYLPKARDCYSLLRDCTSLTEATLSLPQATDCSSLLDGCTSLTEVTLSLPQATDCSSLLDGCPFNKNDINFTWV
jgi:hypothetical protein